MWFATKKYAEQVQKNNTEKQYIKMGSTFFNESIYEYVEKKNEEGGNTKEKVIDYIKQIKSDMEQSKLESEQTINENIDRINKDKKKKYELSCYKYMFQVVVAI